MISVKIEVVGEKLKVKVNCREASDTELGLFLLGLQRAKKKVMGGSKHE